MSASAEFDVEIPSLFRRFGTATEREYKIWLVEQVVPIARVLCYLSIAGWVVNPTLSTWLTEDTRHEWLLYAFAWAFAIPVLLTALLVLRRPATPPLIPVIAGLVIVIYSANVVVFGICFPDLDAGSYAFGITIYCSLGALLRLPFRTTLVTSALISVSGVAFTMAYAAGPPSSAFAGPNAVLPVVTFLLIPGMALLTDRTLRQRFVDEQVIEAQQRQLAESMRLIRRYAPGSVVSHIELGDHTVDHPQRRKVTVFFSDVVGFTTLADRVDPEALAEIVNDYLGSLSELIERHGGTLNEFAGDGVMAIFGAPDELDPAEQVRSAVAAAQELQASLPEWSRDWYQHGIIEDAKARIGINTGTISVGTFGSTIRATYTGIGLQTNIAARVQAEAKPGGILLSNTSWHLIKDTVACEPRGEVMVKGVHFPIELYEPIS